MNSRDIDKLQKIEGELRALVVEVWTMTVDDPETATLESEAAGMTWERAQLRYLVSLISNAADGTEWAINKLLRGES